MSPWLTWPGHAWLALPARVYLAFVFLAACVHKIADPAAFALDVATYQFLSLPLINVFALTLPWVELAAGLALLLGVRVRASALLVALMMLAFLIALAHALHLGLDMGCGCFASSSVAEEDAISWRTVSRDLGWLLLALYVLIFDARPLGLERWWARRKEER